jgi:predicted nucleic acid-binding protein
VTYENKIVLDSDVISSFAWVERFDIVIKLYSPNIIVLDVVKDELIKVKHLFNKVKKYIESEDIELVNIDLNAEEGLEYGHLLKYSWRIGKGEAACMAYCRYHNCILGSNNFADILNYCKEFGIKIKTTVGIMIEAYENKLIDFRIGSRMWKKMIEKRRKLPYKTFQEAIDNYREKREED